LEKPVKRIIIADDHAVVCTGLQLILDETTDMSICDEASNGDELIEKLRRNSYDLVLLDISMTGKDTMYVLKGIKTTWERTPVNFLNELRQDICGAHDSERRFGLYQQGNHKVYPNVG